MGAVKIGLHPLAQSQQSVARQEGPQTLAGDREVRDNTLVAVVVAGLALMRVALPAVVLR